MSGQVAAQVQFLAGGEAQALAFTTDGKPLWFLLGHRIAALAFEAFVVGPDLPRMPAAALRVRRRDSPPLWRPGEQDFWVVLTEEDPA